MMPWLLIGITNGLDKRKMDDLTVIGSVVTPAVIAILAAGIPDLHDTCTVFVGVLEYSLYDNWYVEKCRPAILDPGIVKDRLFCDKTYYLVYASARDRALVHYKENLDPNTGSATKFQRNL